MKRNFLNKATIIKIAWLQHNNRQTNSWNKIKPQDWPNYIKLSSYYMIKGTSSTNKEQIKQIK